MRYVFSIAAVALAFSGATAALADEDMAIRGSTATRPYTVEVKPLPTALSAIPESGALGSVGVGAEAFITGQLAWFVDGDYVDVNVSNSVKNKDRSSNPNQATVNWQNGYELLTGARMYSTPNDSAWYGELGVGYSDIRGNFAYEDVDVASHVISVMPTLTAGYRWLFRNNLTLRLGAGAAANAVQSRTATADNDTPNSAEGEHKVRNLQRTPVVAQVDFGVGYAF